MRIEGVPALEFLKGKDSLLDSRLLSLVVNDGDDGLVVEARFSAREGASYLWVKIVFMRVCDFYFSYSNEYIFGNVERVKFVVTDGGLFYLSIDPDVESGDVPSELDSDFVSSKRIWIDVE